MNSKYIIIHGHFYQPPRENAWLDRIEIQESAEPYHDWNERITVECYAPNGVSRILNNFGKIEDIVNNYARMSFNFGPTLLSWLEKYSPKVYNHILEADKISQELFDGHGSAIAQVYNHLIMPLATRNDKETQVRWGIYDFEKRFNRKPEGMWLAETAVDTETLEVLAENDIKFTILAPNQGKRYRKKGTKAWQNGIDSKVPYTCKLPSGKEITLFFYDGDRSQGVAFKGYLNDGAFFAEQLLGAFDDRKETQLVHIATDGESYGHHHKNGDMALAFCTRQIELESDARITNYSQFLSLTKVEHEVEIHENSSWSCAHGVERWRSNCGCHTGGQPGWTQEWRVGLRDAIDWLRNGFDSVFETEMRVFHPDPWYVRNRFIEVISDRTSENIERFFVDVFGKTYDDRTTTRIIRFLEMEKQSMYMQTSCGWFFNELSGIETIQILQYANRGIQLSRDEVDSQFEEQFGNLLAEAKSNLREHGNGYDIYKKLVKPKRLSLTQVGMHYAVSALFEEDDREIAVLNYDCQSEKSLHKKAGVYILSLGSVKVRSKVTLSHKSFYYAILYLGNHHLVGSTTNKLTEEEFDSIANKIEKSFDNGNIAECIDIIKWNFQDRSFSFFNLFRDEQLKLLRQLTEGLQENALTRYNRIYDETYSLLNLMRSQNLTTPPMLQRNLETVFQFKLENILDVRKNKFSLGRLKRYAVEVRKWNAHLDKKRIGYFATGFISHQIDLFDNYENKVQWMQIAHSFLETLEAIDIHPYTNELQDFIFRLVKNNHLKDPLRAEVISLATHINLHFPQESEISDKVMPSKTLN